MQMQARGSFEVDITPQPGVDGTMLGRMTLAKRLVGELVGTGRGQMLTAGTETPGSAGYVAVERIDGTLQGREGGFSLMHVGTLARGEPTLSITVIPDSGTGALAGIAGNFHIDRSGGQHLYRFDYSLPE